MTSPDAGLPGLEPAGRNKPSLLCRGAGAQEILMKKAIKNIMGRRSFLGAAGAGTAAFWSEDSAAAYQNHVNTNSKPSDLKRLSDETECG